MIHITDLMISILLLIHLLNHNINNIDLSDCQQFPDFISLLILPFLLTN